MSKTVRIYSSELKLIVQELKRHPNQETGGQLLGLLTHGQAHTIFLATGPGPSAIHEHAYFMQSPDIHQQVESFAWREFGLQNIGFWHSHHHLPFHELSAGDIRRSMHYATTHQRPQIVDILGWLIGSAVHIRSYCYADARKGHMWPTEIEVIQGTSPFRQLISKKHPSPEVLTTLGSLKKRRITKPVLHNSEPKPLWEALSETGEQTQIVFSSGVEAIEHFIAHAVPPALCNSIELDMQSEHQFILHITHQNTQINLSFEWNKNLRLTQLLSLRGRQKQSHSCLGSPRQALERTLHVLSAQSL